MLTCKQLTELVTEYLEGRLPLTQRVSFRLHVLMCRHCRTYLQQMRLTVRTLGKLPAEPIPAEVCGCTSSATGVLVRADAAHAWKPTRL